MDRLCNIDKISEEMLEDYMMETFQGIFMIQRVYGMHGVHIKYKFVTPPTSLYKLYCCWVWLLNGACMVECIRTCSTKFDIDTIDVTLFTGMTVNGIVNTYLALSSIFYTGDKRSQIFVKLQNIDKHLKMNHALKTETAVRMNRVTWAVAGANLLTALTWMYLFTVQLMKEVTVSFYVTSVMSAASLTNVFLVIMIMYFISVRVRFLLGTIANKHSHNHKQLIMSLFTVADDKTEQIPEEVVLAIYCILDCFADLMDIFQFTILMFIFQTLWWQLISTQNLVATLRVQMKLNYASFFGTFPYAVYFMVFVVVMCRMAHSISDALDACRRQCSTVVTAPANSKSRENAKRIILLLDGKRDATVYKIFSLDSSLPLNLVGIAASYTIVLLQLAVL